MEPAIQSPDHSERSTHSIVVGGSALHSSHSARILANPESLSLRSMQHLLADFASSPAFRTAVDQLVATALADARQGESEGPCGARHGLEGLEAQQSYAIFPPALSALAVLQARMADSSAIVNLVSTYLTEMQGGGERPTGMPMGTRGQGVRTVAENDSGSDSGTDPAVGHEEDIVRSLSLAFDTDHHGTPSMSTRESPWHTLATRLQSEVHELKGRVALADHDLLVKDGTIQGQAEQLVRARNALEPFLKYVDQGRAVSDRVLVMAQDLEEMKVANAQLAILARCTLIGEAIDEKEEAMVHDADKDESAHIGAGGGASSTVQAPSAVSSIGEKRGRDADTTGNASTVKPYVKRSRVRTSDNSNTALAPSQPQPVPLAETLMLDVGEKSRLTAQLKRLQDDHADANLKLRVLTASLRKAREEALTRAKDAAVAHAGEVRALQQAHAEQIATLTAQLKAAHSDRVTST